MCANCVHNIFLLIIFFFLSFFSSVWLFINSNDSFLVLLCFRWHLYWYCVVYEMSIGDNNDNNGESEWRSALIRWECSISLSFTTIIVIIIIIIFNNWCYLFAIVNIVVLTTVLAQVLWWKTVLEYQRWAKKKMTNWRKSLIEWRNFGLYANVSHGLSNIIT